MTTAGVYIHIPFCRSRCSYCDFATGIYESGMAGRYVGALEREIEDWSIVDGPPQVNTIYFGGGTPSMLTVAQVERVLGALHHRFDVSADVEVTMEMNPGSVTIETLRCFRRLGVNRASFGAQTFDDRELARLGRSHTSEETRQTLIQLREAEFENVSFDLIAGLPMQTLAGWKRNVEEALRLRPEHLSFYLLEVHEGTPLAEHIRRGVQPKPDDELAVEMYQAMVGQSRSAGYEHYEISNLCFPGFASLHNTKYWTGEPYYGFGCSAHSYDGETRRWANERDVKGYVEMLEAGRAPVVEECELSERERRAESVFLGLRLMAGINMDEYRRRFRVDLRSSHAADLDRLSKAGLVEISQDVIKLTTHGALLSNEVFACFV